MDVEIAEFLRSLLRRQQGTSGTTRANQAQAVRPLTTANHPTDPINIYLSEAQLDFLQGFANQCSLSKKAVLTCIVLDYFDILPIAFDNAKTFD